VWSPLGWGRLTGKLRKGQAVPDNTRLKNIPGTGPEVSEEYLYSVVDVLDEIAKETGKTIPQVALNWLLQRPTVSSIIIGARNEEQLIQNLASIGWSLTEEQMNKLNAASDQRPAYPYWHQRQNLKLNPVPVL
jgi:aryl-alcohol dehydrogenase-like predicted oxidoreductase